MFARDDSTANIQYWLCYIGIAKVGHTGAHAPATRGHPPPVQVCLSSTVLVVMLCAKKLKIENCSSAMQSPIYALLTLPFVRYLMYLVETYTACLYTYRRWECQWPGNSLRIDQRGSKNLKIWWESMAINTSWFLLDEEAFRNAVCPCCTWA